MIAKTESSAPRSLLPIHHPQIQTEAELLGGLVLRERLFNRLRRTLSEAAMEVPEQHYLITGHPGMGKTTLLLRLAYSLEQDEAVRKRLIPLVFNEEEYGIRRLSQIWKRCLDLLGIPTPALPHAKEEDTYERRLFEQLTAELGRRRKKAVLFIFNFGRIIQKLSLSEAQRFRKVLQTSPDIRIVAADITAPPAFYEYKHPFYEFFSVMEIKGLDEEDTRAFLFHLAETQGKPRLTVILQQQPARVEALRRLIAGDVRALVWLHDILAQRPSGTVDRDLLALFDRMTPAFKAVMEGLSTQHQALVEAMALHWDAVSVRELVAHTGIESSIVSAQLGSLEQMGLVLKTPTATKNHLYMLSNRVFNLWFLLRNGGIEGQSRVFWLARTLLHWCQGGPQRYATTQAQVQGTPGGQRLQEKEGYLFQYLSRPILLDRHHTQVLGCALQLLAQGHAKWLLQQFERPEYAPLRLRDRFRPLHYAILQHLGLPDRLRMGEELAQTVDEIMAEAGI